MNEQVKQGPRPIVGPRQQVIPAPDYNPLMERFNKMPPETFRLPSGGILYKNGELDPEVEDGEIIIHPMTTVDEITMRSPDMLFQGTAIEKVFLRCMPQVKKPLELLSNDVDYLLICLRMVTYGTNLDIYWSCPKCADEGENEPEIEVEHTREDGESKSVDFLNVKPTYTIDLNTFLQKSRPLKITPEVFTITLSTGEVVHLRPSKYREMLKLYQYDATKLVTPEEMTEFILDGVLSVIDSINDVSNPEHIRQWGQSCEAPVLDELQQEIHQANDWGTTYEYNFDCRKCGHKGKGEVPLNPIHFFTAPSTKQTKA